MHHCINLSLAYQKEELTLSLLKENSSGLIGVLETNYGHFKELFSSLEKIDTSFTKYLLGLSKIFPDNFYLGLEVTNKDENQYANKVRKFADQYTYECVALPRVRYLKKEDAIVLDIVDAIERSEHLEKKKSVGQQYFLKEEDYHKIYTEKEIDNPNKIVKIFLTFRPAVQPQLTPNPFMFSAMPITERMPNISIIAPRIKRTIPNTKNNIITTPKNKKEEGLNRQLRKQ